MTPRALATAPVLAGLPVTAARIHDASAGNKARVAALPAADRPVVNAPGYEQFKSMPLHLAAAEGRDRPDRAARRSQPCPPVDLGDRFGKGTSRGSSKAA